ncbi:hypothetical protein R5R35_010719 [Gryllus longicercus]|uniref:G-protein coupled receptors family 1 profile domain-containing protein n=1 Tax=Gryllus longicercus TaxID=2509291 RepID=A0AAN9V989_9ORTH
MMSICTLYFVCNIARLCVAEPSSGFETLDPESQQIQTVESTSTATPSNKHHAFETGPSTVTQSSDTYSYSINTSDPSLLTVNSNESEHFEEDSNQNNTVVRFSSIKNWISPSTVPLTNESFTTCTETTVSSVELPPTPSLRTEFTSIVPTVEDSDYEQETSTYKPYVHTRKTIKKVRLKTSSIEMVTHRTLREKFNLKFSSSEKLPTYSTPSVWETKKNSFSSATIFPTTLQHDADSKSYSIPSASAPPSNDEEEEDIQQLRTSFKERYPVHLWQRYGFFTDNFLEMMNEAWMKYPPPSPSAHYIMASIYIVLMLVGTSGNGLVVYLFIRSRALRTPANILVLNLAVSDFFLLLDMVLFIYNSVLLGPALGHVGCQLYGFVGGLTGTVSIVTLALIAYDRFNVIVFPMEPSRKTSHASARAMVLCAWLYGATFSSLPLTGIGVSPYTPEGYLTSCSFDYMSRNYVNRVYIFTFFSAAWVLPLCVITFCYSRIYYMVIRTSDVAGAVDSQRHCREEEKKRSELKLAGVVAGVVVLWFVSWTPYAVVALLGITGRHDLITPLSSMVPALFCKTASCIDPFVYAVTHPRFRKELRSLWRARRKKKPERGQGKARRRKTPWTVREEMRAHDRDRDETSDSSEPDVEEVFVMVDRGCDGRESRGSNSTSSNGGGSSEDSRPERSRRGGRRRRSQRISWTVDEPFPFSQNIVNQLQPPSWFVPPQPHSKRSASLRLKEQVKLATGPKSM